MVRDNPHIQSLDIMKEVGRIWQGITKHELEHFKQQSEMDLERFKIEHKRFITEINDLRAENHPDKMGTKYVDENKGAFKLYNGNCKREPLTEKIMMVRNK